MTPLEFARQECANWDQSRCIGAAIDNSTCHPLTACVLTIGEKCAYFERCVLPMANRGNPAFIDARRVYEKTHALAAMARATCVCGRPRAPRKRLCEECRIEQRSKTFREAKRRERLSTVKAENGSVSD